MARGINEIEHGIAAEGRSEGLAGRQIHRKGPAAGREYQVFRGLDPPWCSTE